MNKTRMLDKKENLEEVGLKYETVKIKKLHGCMK